MNRLGALLLLLAALLGAVPAAAQDHMRVALAAERETVAPGGEVMLAFVMRPEPGWHGYWVNPGVCGMALSAKWTLPEGWKAGELKQPVPKRFMTGDLPGFGY